MTLIKSISGIRGTIGGRSGDALTPLDVVKFTAAYGAWLKSNNGPTKVAIGRDARPSGELINRMVTSTLQGMGIDVIDLGLTTTPTVEMAVIAEKAGGGIIITASHNPIQWNALKLLNRNGEFISAEDGAKVLQLAESEDFEFSEVKKIGRYRYDNSYLQRHIEAIVALPLVDKEAITARNFSVVVDAVNSCGGFAVPMLLEELGVKKITQLNCEPTGLFVHNPEPLPEHLTQIANEI